MKCVSVVVVAVLRLSSLCHMIALFDCFLYLYDQVECTWIINGVTMIRVHIVDVAGEFWSVVEVACFHFVMVY